MDNAGTAANMGAGFDRVREGALDALSRADTALDGRLWVVGLGLALFLIILAIPPRRAAPAAMPWPRLWCSGAVAGLAAMSLVILR
jgi:hypothetical protein